MSNFLRGTQDKTNFNQLGQSTIDDRPSQKNKNTQGQTSSNKIAGQVGAQKNSKYFNNSAKSFPSQYYSQFSRPKKNTIDSDYATEQRYVIDDDERYLNQDTIDGLNGTDGKQKNQAKNLDFTSNQQFAQTQQSILSSEQQLSSARQNFKKFKKKISDVGPRYKQKLEPIESVINQSGVSQAGGEELKSLTDLKKSAQVGKVNSLQKYSNPLERELMNEMEEDLMAMFSEAVLNIEDEPKMKESDQQPIFTSLSQKTLNPKYQSSTQLMNSRQQQANEFDRLIEQEFDLSMKDMNQESFDDLFSSSQDSRSNLVKKSQRSQQALRPQILGKSKLLSDQSFKKKPTTNKQPIQDYSSLDNGFDALNPESQNQDDFIRQSEPFVQQMAKKSNDKQNDAESGQFQKNKIHLSQHTNEGLHRKKGYLKGAEQPQIKQKTQQQKNVVVLKQAPKQISEVDESQYIDENDFKTTFQQTSTNNFAPNTQLAFAYDSKADTYYKLRKTNATIKTKYVSFKETTEKGDEDMNQNLDSLQHGQLYANNPILIQVNTNIEDEGPSRAHLSEHDPFADFDVTYKDKRSTPADSRLQKQEAPQEPKPTISSKVTKISGKDLKPIGPKPKMKSSNVGYGSQHTSEKNQQIIQNRVVQDAELVDMTNTNPGKKKDSNSIKVNPSFNLKTLFSQEFPTKNSARLMVELPKVGKFSALSPVYCWQIYVGLQSFFYDWLYHDKF